MELSSCRLMLTVMCTPPTQRPIHLDSGSWAPELRKGIRIRLHELCLMNTSAMMFQSDFRSFGIARGAREPQSRELDADRLRPDFSHT